MVQPASFFLAMEYLRPRRSLITVITFLSVLGPILGVAILIVVLAIMAGFNRDIREKILGMQAHIQLQHPRGFVIENPDRIIDELEGLPVKASPIFEGPVVIQIGQQILPKYIKGILPEKERNVTDIDEHIINGRYAIKEGEVLIGKEFAHRTNISIGDVLLIHSPEKLQKMVSWDDDGTIRAKKNVVYMPEEVTVVGIFSLGMFEYDFSVIIMHFDQASELFDAPWGSATSITIRTEDPFKLDPVIENIMQHPACKDIIPITWKQSNKRLFGALRVEKNLMFFLLIFIMVVAAFGISTTLITLVIQKTREIGVLKALGATPGTILLIFLYQGIIVGSIGTALGSILGITIIYYRNAISELLGVIMGVEVFPEELYHLSQIPAKIQGMDFVMVTGSAIIICILGALIPAIFAALLSPVNALKNNI